MKGEMNHSDVPSMGERTEGNLESQAVERLQQILDESAYKANKEQNVRSISIEGDTLKVTITNEDGGFTEAEIQNELTSVRNSIQKYVTDGGEGLSPEYQAYIDGEGMAPAITELLNNNIVVEIVSA